MTTQFKIYFNDLNDEARTRYLKFQGVPFANELNHEVEPIAILEVEPPEVSAFRENLSAFDGLEPGLVPCKFTSVWDNGAELTTDATYNPGTGHVEAKSVDGDPGSDVLVREYITAGDIELDVCHDCHEYVVETVMGNRADLSYGEIIQCKNPDCESRS